MRCGRTTTTLASAGIPPKASSTSTTAPTCTTPRGRSRVTTPTTSTTRTGRAPRASPLPRRLPSTRTTTREHDRGVPQIVASLRIATELNARESQDARVFPGDGFRQMCSRAVPWLLAVACGSAPAVRPPPPTPAGSATPTSPDVGPALAGSGAHRTALLDRSNWGWYLERSDDAGATWTETRSFVAGSPIVTSRASYDVVTREGNWVHIGRDGTGATTPGVHVEPTSSACASAVLWVPDLSLKH